MSDKRGIDEVTIYIMCQPWIGCWLLAIGGWLSKPSDLSE